MKRLYKQASIGSFNPIASRYASFVKHDPLLQYVAYPFILGSLGRVQGKIILDVGCGEGTLARILASQGAHVVGYDISSEQIELAKRKEKEQPLGINYLISDPQSFKSNESFDFAVSVMSLPYAPSQEYLTLFFSSTYRVLKKGGAFISVVRNPNFKRFGEIFYGRRYTRTGHRERKVEFFDKKGRLLCSAITKDFSREDYEKSALAGGLSKIIWRRLRPSKEGVARLGILFWKKYLVDPPHGGLIVKR